MSKPCPDCINSPNKGWMQKLETRPDWKTGQPIEVTAEYYCRVCKGTGKISDASPMIETTADSCALDCQTCDGVNCIDLLRRTRLRKMEVPDEA